jgi:hypothetical protein
MSRKYIQGIFEPKNPEKYVGDVTKIFFRSSWERKFMSFADENVQVIKWCSEELAIPYFSDVDQKPHRYFPDFLMVVKNNQGEVKKYMVEIKPEAQTLPPKKRSRATQTYLNEVATYSVNTSKWKAAEEWCKKNNMEFIIMTERHLKT